VGGREKKKKKEEEEIRERAMNFVLEGREKERIPSRRSEKKPPLLSGALKRRE